MTTEDRVRKMLVDELYWKGDVALLAADYPLIEKEVIDSFGIFQIVSFIENEFGVTVLDEELVMENFGTIGDIAHLVDSKLPAR